VRRCGVQRLPTCLGDLDLGLYLLLLRSFGGAALVVLRASARQPGTVAAEGRLVGCLRRVARMALVSMRSGCLITRLRQLLGVRSSVSPPGCLLLHASQHCCQIGRPRIGWETHHALRWAQALHARQVLAASGRLGLVQLRLGNAARPVLLPPCGRKRRILDQRPIIAPGNLISCPVDLVLILSMVNIGGVSDSLHLLSDAGQGRRRRVGQLLRSIDHSDR